MGLRIRTNVASLVAQRRLGVSTESLAESSAKLSSGSRINKAADDAAGLAISENLRSGIRSLNMAKRNANDGISIVQTAEGGLTEQSNMLIRLKELAVQSASDTIGNTERGFLDKEYTALKDEIDRIAAITEFNGTRLLVGDTEMPTDMGPKSSFPLEIQVGQSYYETTDALDQRNPVNIIRMDFSNLNSFTTGENSLNIGRADEGTRVVTKDDAHKSIGILDTAITRVNEYRAYLGAVQNRLTSTVQNLGSQVESMNTAQSRIRDTDFAEETAKMTQASILQQAGAAVLTQANQQPRVALSLLQNL